MANIRSDLIPFTNKDPFSIMSCMGFYINKLDDFLDVCLYCKTKPITGNRRKFCSIECAHAYHQPPKKTRTNVDIGSTSDVYRFDGWLSGQLTLPDKVMSVLRALPNRPYVCEDMEEINKILIEELPPTTYVGGTPYIRSKKHKPRNWGRWREKKH